MNEKGKVGKSAKVETRDVPDHTDKPRQKNESGQENVTVKKGKVSDKSKLRALHDALQDPISTCDG